MTQIQLSAEEIQDLSSSYISEGFKKEKWQIKSMIIEPDLVNLELTMTEFGFSSTDPSGFHLSSLTAMEMIAQMMVIYLQHMAGYKVKTREIWVSSVSSHFIKPIRDPDNILIKMIPLKLVSKGSALVCNFECEVTGQTGGLFKSKGKVWLV